MIRLMDERSDPRLMRGLVEALYTEAMLLADEARSYFERYGREERDLLPPLAKVDFSCESLRVTTRLMHVISWLLTQRAVAAGEISAMQAASPERRLGTAQASEPEAIAHLPETAQRLILATMDLHARVARLDDRLDRFVAPPPSPARGLMARLEAVF
jgi:regulator of CtrA degradation